MFRPFDSVSAVKHSKLMTQWINKSCDKATRVTKEIMPENEESTGIQKLVEITFPGAILAIGSAIAGLIFGLYTQQTRLTTQSEYQTKLIEQNISGMREELRELKTRLGAQETFMQEVNTRLIRIESR